MTERFPRCLDISMYWNSSKHPHENAMIFEQFDERYTAYAVIIYAERIPDPVDLLNADDVGTDGYVVRFSSVEYLQYGKDR